MYELPVFYVATLANGLRYDSRIKMAVNGLGVDIKTLLLAHIADNTAINWWLKTEDAQKGRNRPKSLVKLLTSKPDEIAKGFDSGDEFIEKWRELNE